MRIPEKLFYFIFIFFTHYVLIFHRQVDDVIDDVSEDETKEKDSDDITKDSLFKPAKKATAKTKKTKK